MDRARMSYRELREYLEKMHPCGCIHCKNVRLQKNSKYFFLITPNNGPKRMGIQEAAWWCFSKRRSLILV
ncbi:hypothetical protein UABAM_03045 [Candidatus Uabimicrobium amorphum]|uniref:Uncharacterized protein n=1 Tax=Uabimicrobium amorphum TaxID=2596890 RepID=A0A5S9IMY8_UABAM|nr:hypothetical protein UABAM_03045 [Candidatus Uabimicrobium amorphum]